MSETDQAFIFDVSIWVHQIGHIRKKNFDGRARLIGTIFQMCPISYYDEVIVFIFIFFIFFSGVCVTFVTLVHSRQPIMAQGLWPLHHAPHLWISPQVFQLGMHPL